MRPDPAIPKPFEKPSDPDATCCWAAINGNECTCWTPVFDAEPARLCDELPDQPAAEKMCHGCAFRKGTGANALMEEGELEVSSLQPFYCHAGMRRVVAWRHEDGRLVDVDPAVWSEQPIMHKGRVYGRDGKPAKVCAGWVADMRKHAIGSDR